MGEDEAKSPTDEGKNDEETPTVNPEAEEGESKVKPEIEPGDFEHKYKTLLGQHKKLQEDFTVLKGTQADFSGVSQAISEVRADIRQQSESLNLLTDIVSAGAEYNEEIQEKLKKTREAQEEQVHKAAEAQATIARMGEIAQVIDLQPSDEALKGAWEALNKGDHAGAIKLTTIAVKNKVATLQQPPPAAILPQAEKKPVDKEKLRQITTSPSVGISDEDLSPTEKIKKALVKRDKG